MTDYGSAYYWDERYAADETSYDWYQEYSGISSYITPYLSRNADFEIFIPGCGNSRMGSCLFDEGYLNITNVDISTVVINQMDSLYGGKEEMEFSVMDARNLEHIPEQCFDIVIDKALLDTFLCSENNASDVRAYLTEMHRILKNRGTFIILSHAAADRRLSHIKEAWGDDINVDVIPIAKPSLKDLPEEVGDKKNHYLYICSKQQS